MHRETKATSIPAKVKKAVWQRDMGRCVICGSISAGPHCHYIRRSQGGLGIQENIWTGCQTCHEAFDSEATDGPLHQRVWDYLSTFYPGLHRGNLIYKKWEAQTWKNY